MQFSPFFSDFSEQLNVPIVTSAAAVDLEDGLKMSLIFGQGLCFEDRTDNSLINLNQCRHYGITICDNPTENISELILAVDDNLFIPMDIYGNTFGLTHTFQLWRRWSLINIL